MGDEESRDTERREVRFTDLEGMDVLHMGICLFMAAGRKQVD